jgi:hypothetical protein
MANSDADIPNNTTPITYGLILGHIHIFDGSQSGSTVWAINVIKPVEKITYCERYANAKCNGEYRTYQGGIVLQEQQTHQDE